MASSTFLATNEGEARMVLVLYMGKLRLRERDGLAWSHAACESHDWDLPDRVPPGLGRRRLTAGGEPARGSHGCSFLPEHWRRAWARMHRVGWPGPLAGSAEGRTLWPPCQPASAGSMQTELSPVSFTVQTMTVRLREAVGLRQDHTASKHLD